MALNSTLYSLSFFCGSGICKWLSWVILALRHPMRWQSSPGEGAVIWRLDWSSWCQGGSLSCWQVRFSRGLSTGLLVAVVQSLRHVLLSLTVWTSARQASLSFAISWSLLKLVSIESVMPSNHLIFCHPLLLLLSIFPSIRGPFPMSQLFASGDWSIRASALASVLTWIFRIDFL